MLTPEDKKEGGVKEENHNWKEDNLAIFQESTTVKESRKKPKR